MRSRREFVQLSAGIGGAVGFGITQGTRRAWADVIPAQQPLRILFLGGTSFLGPAQVSYALARGHHVTLFNRGRTNAHLFPAVEKLRGDRNDDLSALERDSWDVVIDNSATIPRWVRQSAALLRHKARQYIYVSSLSVYSDTSVIGIREDAPVHQLEDPTVERVTGQTYGGMKALCEREAQRTFGDDRVTVVRPGLIVGPRDGTDRFTYWPVRIHRGGEVLAPGDPSDRVQFIDVRDLGAWMVRVAENGTTGVYNANGPEAPITIAGLLYGIRAATSTPVSFTWVDADFLAEHDVRPWAHMPVWVPPRDGAEGFGAFDSSRAIAAGLTFRPLAETAQDTIRWFETLPEERRSQMRAGLPAEREAEVLAAWHARHG